MNGPYSMVSVQAEYPNQQLVNDCEDWHHRLNRNGGNQPLGKNINIVHDFKVVFM